MKLHSDAARCRRLTPSLAGCLAALVLALSGCQAPPVRDKGNLPSARLPAQFSVQMPDVEPGTAEAVSAAPWWQRFGSRELDALVVRALESNSDLKIASLRISQAKIRAAQTRAGELPTLTAPLRAVAQSPSASSNAQQSSQVALQAIWRPDVWGEQRGLAESAELQVARAVHERENMQRLVIGTIVNLYIGYLASSDAIDMAQKNEAVIQEILVNIEKRASLGDATASELEQQRAALGVQQALMPGLVNQRDELRINLARMLGVLPAEMDLTDRGVETLRVPALKMTLPSELLLNRPDIRMMEDRMRAANADINVARARLMPSVDLSVQAGLGGVSLLQLFSPQNLLVNATAAIAATIFDGGRREGNKAYAESYYEEMVETYAQTVYQAVREVESALSSLRAGQLQREAQDRTTRAALNMFKIASDAYELGSVDLTVLLDARKNYQRNLEDAMHGRERMLKAYAALFNALADSAN